MASSKSFVDGLTDILVRMKLLSEHEASVMDVAFAKSSKERFDEFLLDQELVERDDLLKALSLYYQVPSFDVVGYFFDHHLVQMFPKETMLQHGFIPLEVDENMLIVVASEPSDDDLLSVIGDFVSYDIRFRVGFRGDILDAVKEFYDESLTELKPDTPGHEERLYHEAEQELEQDYDIIDMIDEEDE